MHFILQAVKSYLLKYNSFVFLALLLGAAQRQYVVFYCVSILGIIYWRACLTGPVARRTDITIRCSAVTIFSSELISRLKGFSKKCAKNVSREAIDSHDGRTMWHVQCISVWFKQNERVSTKSQWDYVHWVNVIDSLSLRPCVSTLFLSYHQRAYTYTQLVLSVNLPHRSTVNIPGTQVHFFLRIHTNVFSCRCFYLQ